MFTKTQADKMVTLAARRYDLALTVENTGGDTYAVLARLTDGTIVSLVEAPWQQSGPFDLTTVLCSYTPQQWAGEDTESDAEDRVYRTPAEAADAICAHLL